MTTGKVSSAAQLAIQQINQAHRGAGSFTVELFTWDKITKLLRQYPEVEQQFYRGMRAEEVAEVKVKLEAIHSAIAVIGPAVSAKTEIDALIDEARERIKPGEAQIAITLLHRVQRLKGDQHGDWHRFRISTNLGAANLILGKGNEAARNFLDAAPLRPDDELAVANEVLAYHLLLQEQTTREKAEAAAALPECDADSLTSDSVGKARNFLCGSPRCNTGTHAFRCGSCFGALAQGDDGRPDRNRN